MILYKFTSQQVRALVKFIWKFDQSEGMIFVCSLRLSFSFSLSLDKSLSFFAFISKSMPYDFKGSVSSSMPCTYRLLVCLCYRQFHGP